MFLVLILVGTVLSADGVPVEGATVVLHQGGRVETVATDATGAFRFPGAELPALIEVSAPGFAPVRRVVTNASVEVRLAPASVAESIIVTAERASVWRDAATGVTVLSRADLDVVPAETPDEALRSIAGFSLFRRSTSRASNPTTHGVTMRGLSASGASRGLILLDGVPLNDGFGGWVTWTRVPPLAIDRIDVERGAAGDAFGSDALGGAVRLVTPAPAAPSLSAAAEGGSRALAAIDASAGGRLRAASLFGAFRWFRTDGAIPLAPESRGAVDRPADADWRSGYGRAALIGRSHRLTVSGWGGRDDRGNGTALQRNRMTGGTVAASFDLLSGGTTVAARVSVSPNGFDQTFTAVAASRATETLTATQRTETTATRMLVEFGRNVPGGHVLARGALTRTSAEFSERRPTSALRMDLQDDGESISVHGGFTPAGPLTIGAGARHEWRAAPAVADSRDEATVGHVSAAWRLSDRVTARGTAATSHRWPTLNELVRNFQVGAVLTRANPNLRPERAVSVDGGVAVRLWRSQASATVFRTVVDDAIANVTVSTSPIVRERRNAGDARSTGVELDVEASPWAAVRLRASAALMRARFANSAEAALEGRRLPQVPHASWALTADAPLPGRLVGSFVWRAVSSQFDDDRNQFRLSSGSQVDLRVAGPAGPFGWQVVVENAFDARFEVGRTPLVTLAPPRSVRAGVTWRR